MSMKALDPFDASVLAVLADLPVGDELARGLVDRLDSEEAREIGRVLVAPDQDEVEASEAAKITARALTRQPFAIAR